MPLMHYTEICIKNTLCKRKERWEMDFANRGNRPSQAPQAGGQQNEQQPSTSSFQPMGSGGSDKKDKSKPGGLAKFGPMVMVFAITVILVALIALMIFGGSGEANNAESDLIDTNKYQAVFLDSQDGQVYFGKLEVYNGSLYRLTDIFYVRVEQPIQPEGADQVQQQANISLAKLGNELHGPEDVMMIRRDKVLYWENLKDDGQVVTAIKEFDANGRQTQDTQQQTQQPQQQQPQPTGTEQQNDTPTGTETPADAVPTTP